MSQENAKRKSVKGTIWSFADNFMTIGCSFVIGIVLARILSPSDYGTVGVLSIFLSLANVFVDCGFGTAIIRKKIGRKRICQLLFTLILELELLYIWCYF